MTTRLEAVPPRAKVALLIDGDPLSPKVIGQALARAETVGDVAIRRVYANWRKVPKGWREVLNQHQVTHRHDETTPSGKNATDIALVVDALKLFYCDGIRHFCLVASDSDYTALVRELRKQGCVIMGMGQAETPLTLRQACTTFVLIKKLQALPTPARSLPSRQKGTPTRPLEALTTLLVSACRQAILATKSEWIALGLLGQALKQRDPQFKTHSYGYKTLTKLVAAQSALLETRGQGGSMQVRLRRA